MRSWGRRLWRMASAASRAMATRLLEDMEPEASSTSVTLTGLSSTISGAWKAMRARCMPPSSGWPTRALEMANSPSLGGGA